MKNTWVINPYLKIFQAKLLQPNVAANGRWTIYSPLGNKTSVALGKDHFPKILKIILDNWNKEDVTEYFDEKTFNLLKDSEIIVKSDNISTNDDLSFDNFYNIATYNYPFRDYSRSDWLERDNNTMKEYAKYGTAPSPLTNREFLSKKTIKSKITNFNFENLIPEATITDLQIFQILFNVFTPKEIISREENPSTKTIVPSGGGKHPIEVSINVENTIGNIEPGFYTYDIAHNTLIRNEKDYKTFHRSPLTFVLSFNPDRPSWRYRDIRSFRAVYIDAGHVTKMITELLDLCGIEGYEVRVPAFLQNFNESFDWLDEPQIVEISLNSKKSNIPYLSTKTPPTVHPNRLKTTPFGLISCEKGKLWFETLYPKKSKIEITIDEFNIINQCIPSRRRDREDRYDKLINIFESSSLNKLIKNNILIDSEESSIAYSKTLKWSYRNWYINLLEHINQMSNKNTNFKKIEIPKSIISTPNKLIQRQTVRKFNDHALSVNEIKKILSPFSDNKNTIEAFINIKNSNEVPSGLYKLSQDKIDRIDDVIAVDKIKECVVNQPFSGIGQLDIFLNCNLSKDGYLMSLLKLGILCQTIINNATELGVGCFMTPAINDSITHKLFNTTKDSIFYYLEIGRYDL